MFGPFWAFCGVSEKIFQIDQISNFRFVFGTFLGGTHKKAQNGLKILGSIFPVFVFQKSSGLDLRADLVIKIQGDLSWNCPFQELEFAIQHFKSEGYEQSQFLPDGGA